MRATLGFLLMTLLVLPTVADDTVRVKNLKTLCVIYRGDADEPGYMSNHAVLQAKNGVELARLFYFRNSRAKLNCELHWYVVDEPPPDTRGPTMEHIVADLRQRGVRLRQYDGLFVTGVGLSGNFGGFRLAHGVAGCFGGHSVRGGLTWYPEDDPDVAYGTAWNFAHEYQHAIDLVIAEESKRPDLLHAHPYVDRNEKWFKGCYDGGEHWDWIACTLREFEGWMELKGTTNSFLDCKDADGDGLPDDDRRLPMDEKRFGSDVSKKDSDGDGLNDLGEFIAGRYRGSDPNKADSDGDGVSDGQDRYPVVAIAQELPYVPARSKGGESLESARLLSSAYSRNDGDGKVCVIGYWNVEGLYFAFFGPRAFRVLAKIDGSSANGFWQGGDTYLLSIGDGKVEFAGLGLSGQVPLNDPVTEFSGCADDCLFHALIPARLGQGVSKEINYGGKREAEDVVDRLTLVAGRSIALNFIFEFEDGTRACLTPHHTMYAVKLVKPADAPECPILRAPQETNAAVPTAEVFGVRSQTKVEVLAKMGGGATGGLSTSAERVVGVRIGPGPVHLTGIDADGTWELWARAGEVTRRGGTMIVDRTAASPSLRMEGTTLAAECEPRAQFELWWGLGGKPVAPLAGARADEHGRATFELDESLIDGWLVAGFEGSRFEQRVFVEAWDKIDRNYQSGRPDGRLPADAFSYRFEGILMVADSGTWTFELSSDDGSRMWIDDELVINHWGHHGLSSRSATVDLTEGPHRVRIDYYELDGWAGIKLRGAPVGQELSFDLPICRTPMKLDEIELFGVQTDGLGNRSGYGGVTK